MDSEEKFMQIQTGL